MELEELKTAWVALDKQLKTNNLLSESLVREMLHGKTNKAINKLLLWEMVGVVASLIFIPLLINFLCKLNFPLSGNILLYFCLIVLTACLIWYPIKISKLMKLNPAKEIGNTILHLNKYAILIKWEKQITYFFILPIVYILAPLAYYQQKVGVQLWVFLVCVLLFCLFITIWIYKRIYQKNIDTIQDCIEEIKALKEE